MSLLPGRCRRLGHRIDENGLLAFTIGRHSQGHSTAHGSLDPVHLLIQDKILGLPHSDLGFQLVIPGDHFEAPAQDASSLVDLLNSDLHACLVWNTVDLTHTTAQGMEKPELDRLCGLNG